MKESTPPLAGVSGRDGDTVIAWWSAVGGVVRLRGTLGDACGITWQHNPTVG